MFLCFDFYIVESYTMIDALSDNLWMISAINAATNERSLVEVRACGSSILTPLYLNKLLNACDLLQLGLVFF